jgi:hypothetical protein
MADEIKLPYRICTHTEAADGTITETESDPFADAEPYHYGEGVPSAGYYLPIGEDSNDSTTTDIKVQAPENNGYSIIKKLDGFRAGPNEESLKYIEKGTFPLLNLIGSYSSPYISNTTCKPEDADKDNGVRDPKYSFCKLIITYDNKEISSITLNYYNLTTNTKPTTEPAARSTTIYNTTTATFEAHAGETIPKRLGFILTGGGGGAGGIGQFDPNKNGSGTDQFILAGGSGSGAEIVYGVFDLTYPTWSDLNLTNDITELTFTIALGRGGAGGAHGSANSVAHKDPHPGSNGSDGEDSIIYVSAGNIVNEEILRACKGSGGAAGS